LIDPRHSASLNTKWNITIDSYRMSMLKSKITKFNVTCCSGPVNVEVCSASIADSEAAALCLTELGMGIRKASIDPFP
jgi:hypothetical protein